MTPIHIVADKKDIAPLVLLPGDPLRAKYIAENYLENIKLINTVRNMFGYTGTYKNVKVTVIGSGMGIPSVGIYSYELYKFFDVKKIIRIGTAGSANKSVKIRDLVLSTSAVSDSNFGYALLKSKDKKISSANELNQIIIKTAQELKINLIKGPIYTSEIFNVYVNIDHLLNKIPKTIKPLAIEMEAFGLYQIASFLNKQATTLVSVVDSPYEKNFLTSEEREKDLNEMIILALESIIK